MAVLLGFIVNGVIDYPVANFVGVKSWM